MPHVARYSDSTAEVQGELTRLCRTCRRVSGNVRDTMRWTWKFWLVYLKSSGQLSRMGD